jgi:hypothetical protein
MWHTAQNKPSSKETLRDDLEKSVTFKGKQREFRTKIFVVGANTIISNKLCSKESSREEYFLGYDAQPVACT